MTLFVRTRADSPVQGPFTPEQFKKLAASGQLKGHFLVSKDQKTWYPLAKVKNLPVEQAEVVGAPAAGPASDAGAAAVLVAEPVRPPVAPQVAAPPTTPQPATPPAAPPAAAPQPPDQPPPTGPRAVSFPVVAALAGGLVVAVIVIIVLAVCLLVRGGDGADRADTVAAPAASADASAARPGRAEPAPRPAGQQAAARRPPATPVTSPATVPPPSAGAVDAPAPPLPRPRGKVEPPAPAGSLGVLGVAYVGQEVQAMGSRLSFRLTSTAGKDIKTVAGEIRLYDPSGVYLVGLPLEVDEPIQAGATVTTGGTWPSVGGMILGLLNSSAKQMAFKFVAAEVAYADGTTAAFPAK